MNSLWNFEAGLSVPQENEVHVDGSCWLPATPAKPVPPIAHATPIHQSESLLGRLNWLEFAAPSNDYLHEIPSCSNHVQPTNQCEKMHQTEDFFGLNFDFVERNQITNQSIGAYTQGLGIGNSGFRTGSLSDILASGDAAFMSTVEESLTRSLVADSEALNLNFPVQSTGWTELDTRGTPDAAEDDTFDTERLNADCQCKCSNSSTIHFTSNAS